MDAEQFAQGRPPEQKTGTGQSSLRVLVTGASGFVGRAIVRELVAQGHRPICFVRSEAKLLAALPMSLRGSVGVREGDLFDERQFAAAVGTTDAVIHCVGILVEQPRQGQTFARIHVEATRRVVDACRAMGVRRLIHTSAMGTRPDAPTEYHRSKWASETIVRESGLDWTIFRPSIIHGPDGIFMQMMRRMICDATVPAFGFIPIPLLFVPHLGDGESRVQPVSVLDVAFCLVAALRKPEAICQTYELGGPRAMSWREMYVICRETMPGARRWKPVIGQPVCLAKLAAKTVMKLPILPRLMRFNVDQVILSQEDSVCDTRPVEQTFGIKLRDFREELTQYASSIPA
ncbi:MAG TPA: complex I NDUFA9 subunit family protein [Phycisphaerae bacterium]|nr:complex I NDUFA9 subunit family protein [Phycisphaerae bacterium]